MKCDSCKKEIGYNTSYVQGEFDCGKTTCQWCLEQGIVKEKKMSPTFEDIKKLYQKKSQEKLMRDKENDDKTRQNLLNEIYKRLDQDKEPIKELYFSYNTYNDATIYKSHFLNLGFKVKENYYNDDHDSNYDRYDLIVSGWA